MDEKFDWKAYAPYFLGVIFACSLLNLWFVTSLAVDNGIVPESYKIFFAGLFGLLTTVTAVILGYYINKYQKNKEAKKELIIALQSNIFLLSAKLHQLRCFYNSNMQSLSNQAEIQRAHKLPAFLPNIEIEPFNLTNLIPLQEKLAGDLLDLSILDQRYLLSFRTLNNRSELHHKKIQPIYDEWLREKKKPKQPSTVSYLDYFISNYVKLHMELIESTNNCYDLFQRTINSFEGMQSKLLALAQEAYPKEDFFDLETILVKNIEQ